MGNAQMQNGEFDPSDPANQFQGMSPEQMRKLLECVSNTIFPRRSRLSLIAECIYEFDHRAQPQHDLEIREGVPNVLFQKLAFATSLSYGKTILQDTLIPETSSSESDHEIALICTALEMVYRASDQAIEESWGEIGVDMLPLIIQIIERSYDAEEIKARMTMRISSVSKDRKIAVQKMTKVLAAFSLVGVAKTVMARERGMLTCLVKVLDVCGFNRMGSEGGGDGIGEMSEAARFNAVATLTNLAFDEENRQLMMNEPGLVLSISVVANSAKTELARKCAHLALSNLHGQDPNNPNPQNNAIPKLAGCEYLLKTLVKHVRSNKPSTRRNAAVSLYNLASSDEKANLIAQYGDEVILNVLIEIIGGDESLFWNEKAKPTAAEKLFSMSMRENDRTIDLVANHPRLLRALSDCLSGNADDDGNAAAAFVRHESIDVMLYCAATIRRLSELIFAGMPQHGALLDALTRCCISWMKTDDVAAGFDIQASSQVNAAAMVDHPEVLDCLSEMARLEGSEGEVALVRSRAVCAIEKLSQVVEVKERLVKNEMIMLALTRVRYIGSQKNKDANVEALEQASRLKVKNALKNLIVAM